MKKLSFVLFLAFIIGCSSVPITGRKQISLVSDEKMTQMGIQAYNEIISNSTVIKTGEEAELVAKVGRDIAAAAEAFLKESGMEKEISNYSWAFSLIQDKSVNAFCLPGGKIAVYTGILPITKNAEGLAVVIGHEVAHAIAKHGKERASQQEMKKFGGNLLSVFTSNTAVMVVYEAGTQLGLLLPYSRKHEIEADRIGLILMARAGYDPNAALAFWQAMSAGGSNSDFLSTHPSDSKRIESIKEVIPEAMKYYKK
ncbi:MAG: M48 family metallopeptidase [Endomicrobia bacterium]|nr:M48 family metallopeptidase [Endomicrobiia bacterium]MCL2506115.1 M48 family metallopeptidase [Endomicrobiia bacterium]